MQALYSYNRMIEMKLTSFVFHLIFTSSRLYRINYVILQKISSIR